MLKKIRITDPVSGISAVFNGIIDKDTENKIAARTYSMKVAKSRFAEDLVLAQSLVFGNGYYNQTPIWDDQPAAYEWKYSPNYRELQIYKTIEELEERLIIEEMD